MRMIPGDNISLNSNGRTLHGPVCQHTGKSSGSISTSNQYTPALDVIVRSLTASVVGVLDRMNRNG